MIFKQALRFLSLASLFNETPWKVLIYVQQQYLHSKSLAFQSILLRLRQVVCRCNEVTHRGTKTGVIQVVLGFVEDPFSRHTSRRNFDIPSLEKAVNYRMAARPGFWTKRAHPLELNRARMYYIAL